MNSSTNTNSLMTRRLVSLDAFRGFTMLAMASSGLGIRQLAKNNPDSELLQSLSFQLSHVDWQGWAAWDMIQPAFMFIVGVSMAYSYAFRQARGDSYGSMFRHALKRSLVLILLGVFLRSNHKSHTYWTFTDVLSQIGFGYTFLFLLWNRKTWIQVTACIGILVGYWGLFAAWPLPGPDFDYAATGVAPDWEYNFSGFYAHWNKNTNPAHDFDVFFLNLFPRSEPFTNNSGGYQTLNFIPSLVTMLIGLICGETLRRNSGDWSKFFKLSVWGILLTVAGVLLDHFGVCPLVKRIWTPSWAVFSSGIVMFILALFYLVIDLVHFQIWAWPGIIVGMNSIAFYVMNALCKGWIAETLKTHFGENVFAIFGTNLEPVTTQILLLLVLFLIVWWMNRQRIFIRI